MLKTMLFVWIGFSAIFASCQEPSNPSTFGTGVLTSNDAVHNNTLRYGLSSSTAFDDHAVGLSGESNLTNSIRPEIELSVSRPRTQSRIYYGPSYTFSNTVERQTDSSQAFGIESEHLFTRRLALSVRGSYLNTSNFFENVTSAERLPQLGVLDQPNELLTGANIHATSDQLGSDITYRTSRYTSIGIGGSFSKVIYRTISEEPGVGNDNLRSQAWSAHTFLSHRMSSLYSIGVNYSAQGFSSPQTMASTLTHSALGFVTVSVTPQIQLSMFVGPEVSQIDDAASSGSILPSERALTLSFGSTLNWQGERNGLAAEFVQRVNNSIESSSAAVRARMLHFRAGRQLTKRFAMNLFANYASNASLGSSLAGLAPDSITGGLGITRPLTPSISLRISAFHQEFLSPVSTVFGSSKHNVVSGSLSYSFARPIGR